MDTTILNSKDIQGKAGKIHLIDEGNGFPILFTHSFGGSHNHWHNQVTHFANNHRVIAIDFRGHGESDVPNNSEYSAESLADDIAAVVGSLNIDRFILIGHSMGGAASIAYAGKYPEHLEALIVTGTPGKSDEKESKQIIAAIESDSYQKVMDEYMDKLLLHATPEVDKLVRGEFKRLPKETTIQIIKAMFEFDPLPSLNKYDGPKFIIYTEMEEQPNALKNQVKDVQNLMFRNTSHWIQLDRPDDFNRAVESFIESIDK